MAKIAPDGDPVAAVLPDDAALIDLHQGCLAESIECFENCRTVQIEVRFCCKKPVALQYSCHDGTAGRLLQYLPVSGVLNFSELVSTATVTVPIVDEEALEKRAYFTVEIAPLLDDVKLLTPSCRVSILDVNSTGLLGYSRTVLRSTTYSCFSFLCNFLCVFGPIIQHTSFNAKDDHLFEGFYWSIFALCVSDIFLNVYVRRRRYFGTYEFVTDCVASFCILPLIPEFMTLILPNNIDGLDFFEKYARTSGYTALGRCLLLSTVLIRFIDVALGLLSSGKQLFSKHFQSEESVSTDEVLVEDDGNVAKAATGHSSLIASKLILVMMMTSLLTMVFFVSFDSSVKGSLDWAAEACSVFGHGSDQCDIATLMLTADTPEGFLKNLPYQGLVAYLKVNGVEYSRYNSLNPGHREMEYAYTGLNNINSDYCFDYNGASLCMAKFETCHVDKNDGVIASANRCDSAVILDMTALMNDFWEKLAYLILCVVGLVLAALFLILWDLIGLLFTPLVQAVGLVSHVKTVWDTEGLPQRTKQAQQMVTLAEEVKSAQGSWLSNSSDEDLVRAEQMRDLCRRLNSCADNLAQQDQTEEAESCRAVLVHFKDPVLAEGESTNSGGSAETHSETGKGASSALNEDAFNRYDKDGDGMLDADEVKQMQSLRREAKEEADNIMWRFPDPAALVELREASEEMLSKGIESLEQCQAEEEEEEQRSAKTDQKELELLRERNLNIDEPGRMLQEAIAMKREYNRKVSQPLELLAISLKEVQNSLALDLGSERRIVVDLINLRDPVWMSIYALSVEFDKGVLSKRIIQAELSKLLANIPEENKEFNLYKLGAQALGPIGKGLDVLLCAVEELLLAVVESALGSTAIQGDELTNGMLWQLTCLGAAKVVDAMQSMFGMQLPAEYAGSLSEQPEMLAKMTLTMISSVAFLVCSQHNVPFPPDLWKGDPVSILQRFEVMCVRVAVARARIVMTQLSLPALPAGFDDCRTVQQLWTAIVAHRYQLIHSALSDAPNLPPKLQQTMHRLIDEEDKHVSAQDLGFLVALTILKEAHSPWMAVVASVSTSADENNLDLFKIAQDGTKLEFLEGSLTIARDQRVQQALLSVIREHLATIESTIVRDTVSKTLNLVEQCLQKDDLKLEDFENLAAELAAILKSIQQQAKLNLNELDIMPDLMSVAEWSNVPTLSAQTERLLSTVNTQLPSAGEIDTQFTELISVIQKIPLWGSVIATVLRKLQQASNDGDHLDPHTLTTTAAGIIHLIRHVTGARAICRKSTEDDTQSAFDAVAGLQRPPDLEQLLVEAEAITWQWVPQESQLKDSLAELATGGVAYDAVAAALKQHLEARDASRLVLATQTFVEMLTKESSSLQDGMTKLVGILAANGPVSLFTAATTHFEKSLRAAGSVLIVNILPLIWKLRARVLKAAQGVDQRAAVFLAAVIPELENLDFDLGLKVDLESPAAVAVQVLLEELFSSDVAREAFASAEDAAATAMDTMVEQSGKVKEVIEHAQEIAKQVQDSELVQTAQAQATGHAAKAKEVGQHLAKEVAEKGVKAVAVDAAAAVQMKASEFAQQAEESAPVVYSALCTAADKQAHLAGIAFPVQIAYFAHLSKLAYEPLIELDPSVRCIDRPDIGYRAFIHKDDHVTIVCRGTQSAGDAIDDINIRASVEVSGIKLHAGFHERADLIFQDLFQEIEIDLLNSCSIDITGHSLGGAAAVVLGILLKGKALHVRKIVTFGQPRVLRKECAHPDLPLLRVVNGMDVVTRVPPEALGFVHIKEEGLRLFKDGTSTWEAHVTPERDDNITESDSLLDKIKAKLDLSQIEDHSSTLYCNKLNTFYQVEAAELKIATGINCESIVFQ